MEHLPLINLLDFPKLRTAEYMSPFRYPGGKTFLTGYLASILDEMPRRRQRHYVEPFCGGAGAAISLLAKGCVSKIHLNDADPRIFSAWKAILQENERFLDKIAKTPVSVETFLGMKDLVVNAGPGYSFDVGFATFFVNRTSRSGIVLGSGPIGGYDQSGRWKIDARYYIDTVMQRVRWLGENRRSIKISNLDALSFLKDKSTTLAPDQTLYFVDPPYVTAGSRLYLNAMTEQKHNDLAIFLQSGTCEKWVLTYDDHPLIRSLYSKRNIYHLSVNYSLRSVRKEMEILVR
ncbi:DNA adenine methylase [Allorhizobium undicola]|uniref:DNA adenine methylase n=1 Tax=Allorhizobium undicola TaxID=78527 RepID=UPI001FDA7B49|nr:DNA adenine methylase [Allorhizobium undicola]